MFDVAQSLRDGLESAQTRLRDAQDAVARANAGASGRESGAAMSETARAAIFDEALLSSIRARFEELKAVSK